MKVVDSLEEGEKNNFRKKQSDYFTTDHLKVNLKKRAVRGGGASIAARSADFFIQLGGTVLLARVLSPEDFGLVAMVVTITGFFLIFKDLGLTEATIQSEHINHDQVSTLFWINALFSVFLAIVVSLSSPLVARFFNEPRLKLITVISSVSFILAGLTNQHLALLRRGMHFYKIAIIEIGAALGSTGLTIALALRGASYWALVARPLIQIFLTGCGVWLLCTWRPGLPVRHAGVRRLITFGANALGYFCINYFSRNLDKALVGWKSGAGALGYYSRAYYLFVVPINQFCIPLHGVAVTTLTKLRNDPERFKKFYMQALTAISFVGMPLSTFLASVGRELILLLLGPQWTAATGIFMIFGLSAGIQIIYSTKSWLHVALGRTDRWLRWGIIATIITSVLFFIGLPFGATGVAIGYTLSLYILTIPAILYAGRPVQFGLRYLLSGIWRYYIAAAGAGSASWLLAQILPLENLIAKIALCFMAFSTIYLALIVLLFGTVTPLIEFIDIVKDMVPSSHKRKITPKPSNK